MEWNDLEPQKEKPKPKNLAEMSIAALGEYIDELQAEIARAEAMIKSKRVLARLFAGVAMIKL